MTCFLTTFLRVYRETQEFLQLHFVCLFVSFSNFFFCPNCHSKSESRPWEKRSLPHLQHLLPGQTSKNTCACVPRAGRLYLKSATYKESSHSDASLVSSATQKAQLRAVWVQNQPAQEGLLATVHALPGHTEGQRYFPYDW